MKSGASRRGGIPPRLEGQDHTVEELLRNIEAEPVPDRLLVLARQLQEALQQRKSRLCGTADSEG